MRGLDRGMNEEILREHIVELASQFKSLDAAIFTTYQFSQSFFESNVLPSVLGIEERGKTASRKINYQLARTELCVFYDSSAFSLLQQPGGGRFRYQAVGISTIGKVFHPKIVLLAGDLEKDGLPCIFITVCSANLTRAGWGENCEVFSTLNISSKENSNYKEIEKMIDWLNLTSRKGSSNKKSIIAIQRCRDIMANMPLRNPRSREAISNGSFYFSPLHSDGFMPFLQAGQTAPWDELIAFSPYWSDVETNIKNANARKNQLVPALMNNGYFGIAKDEIPNNDEIELMKIKKKIETRFWHAKLYFLRRGNRLQSAVGSCNFTKPALSGGNTGNVEAMIVFQDEDWDSYEDISLISVSLEDPMITDEVEAGPEPCRLVIEVTYDWKAHSYTIYFQPENAPDCCDYRLLLPGGKLINLDNITQEFSQKDSEGPLKTNAFKLEYKKGDNPIVFFGLVMEINLDFSDKPYLQTLSVLDIIEGWKRNPEEALLSYQRVDGDGENNEYEFEAPREQAKFDVLNLYEMYRGIHERLVRITDSRDENNISLLRAFLVSGPDSVYAMSKQAFKQEDVHPIHKFLILNECRSIMRGFKKELPDSQHLKNIEEWCRLQRQTLIKMKAPTDDQDKYIKTIEWFEEELEKAWQ